MSANRRKAMKHTPGPWTTDPEALTEINGHAHFFIPIVRPVEEGEYEGRGVAVCILPTEDATTEESIIMEANARLIAAAPDLYEALERIVGACSGYLEDQVPSESDMYNPEYVGPLEQARAALAKVEE